MLHACRLLVSILLTLLLLRTHMDGMCACVCDARMSYVCLLYRACRFFISMSCHVMSCHVMSCGMYDQSICLFWANYYVVRCLPDISSFARYMLTARVLAHARALSM